MAVKIDSILSKRDLPALAVALGWLLVGLVTLRTFPTVFIDEAENANHAFNLAFHHHAVFSLYDDLYPAPVYGVRQAWVVVIRPFFIYPLAWSLRLLGFSWVKARAFNTAVGFLALLTVYATGRVLQGRRLGFLALCLLGTRFAFLYCSHSIRPEMLLCLDAVLILLALALGPRYARPWGFLAAGFLAGAAGGIHTNGILLIGPILFVLALEDRWPPLAAAAAGWVFGLTLFLLSADWERFLPGLPLLFFSEFNKPPLIAQALHPLLLVNAEIQRYVGPWIFSDWRHGDLFRTILVLQALLYAGAVAWGLAQKNAARRVALFGLMLFLAYALFIGQKAYNYSVVLEPCFALALSFWLLAPPHPARQVIRGLVGVCTLATVVFCVNIGFYRPPFAELCRHFSSAMRPGARVAGPQTLWLGLADYDYRDVGGLMWYRLLLGENNLVRPLEHFRPDYLILDRTLFTRIDRFNHARHARDGRPPTGLFPWPHRVLSVVDAGPAYGGELVLIENDWPSPHP